MNINNSGQQYTSYGTGTPKNTFGTGRTTQSGGLGDSPFSITNTGATGETDTAGSLVDLSSANRVLLLADHNLDGLVDQQELAMASYQLLSNESATAEDKVLGQMLATMVQGGADGTGLFPDLNGDGGLSSNELSLLAKGDDDASTISSADFQFAYGNKAQAGGNTISLDGLRQIATGNTGATNPPAGNGQTPTGGTGSSNGANQQPTVEQSTISLLEAVINYLKNQNVGKTTSKPPAEETPASGDEQPVTNNGSQQQANPFVAIFSLLGNIIKLMIGMMGARQQA